MTSQTLQFQADFLNLVNFQREKMSALSDEQLRDAQHAGDEVRSTHADFSMRVSGETVFAVATVILEERKDNEARRILREKV